MFLLGTRWVGTSSLATENVPDNLLLCDGKRGKCLSTACRRLTRGTAKQACVVQRQHGMIGASVAKKRT